MPSLRLDQFYGVAPRVPARSLAPGMAQVARNVDLSVPVELKPLHGNRDVQALPISASGGAVQTLYLYENAHWFTFFEDTDVVRGPLPEDPTARTYISDSLYPKVTRNDVALGSGRLPQVTYRLGVPKPATPPTVDVSGVGDKDNRYPTAYVYTYVTAWGDEGPPSDPSPLTFIDSGQIVDVNFALPPAGEYNWNAIRIYRLNSGEDSAFQLVAEVPSASTTFNDTVANEDLAEVIPTETWYPPPDDTHPTGPLRGLVPLNNGSLAGFTGETVCVSLPNLPHAWPFEARYTLTEKVVALLPVQQGLVVLTEGIPYLLAGTDPSSLSFSRLPDNQACVSKRSVVDLGGAGIYASPEGLVVCDGARARVATEGVYSEAEWRARFKPESIHAYLWEGKYLGFYDNGTERGGFIFDPNGEKVSFSEIDLYADAGYSDRITDQLYLNVGSRLVVFSDPSEAPLTCVWRSGALKLPVPSNQSVLRLVADGSVIVRIYADGVLIHTLTSTSDLPYRTHRLPSGHRSKEWEMEVETSGSVYSMQLATSTMELTD